MQDDQNRFSYSPHLDGLRGLAILPVMLFHARVPWMSGGFIGVDLFFVLSGFLITTLLMREFQRHHSIKFSHFYMRRFLRLAPPLLALVVLNYVFVFSGWGAIALSDVARSSAAPADSFIESFIALFYLTNWARAFDWHAPQVLGHTWSLSIEEQFYLIWPIVLLLLLRIIKVSRVIALATLLLALAPLIVRWLLLGSNASWSRLYNGFDTRADGLLLGAALAALLSSLAVREIIEVRLSGLIRVIAPLSILWLFYYFTQANWEGSLYYNWGMLAVNIITMFLIVDLQCNPKSLIKPIFGNRSLVAIGRVSYGLYLWHYPVYYYLFLMGFEGWQVLLWGNAIVGALTVASYYFLERPILSFKRYFTRS